MLKRERRMKLEFVHIKVKGRVQGVFYRQSTLQKAQQLGLSGFVRNCEDGSVEALVIGEPDKIADLLIFCRQGPPHARVDDLTSSPLDVSLAQGHLQQCRLDLSDFYDNDSDTHQSHFTVVKGY
ncbi:MAG: acylphosphatase [Candidatus Obscuribacter sp.]|jgi:acylphosphatase|nr:acylphosphatase [Candidatus Obscuribacter sp.]